MTVKSSLLEMLEKNKGEVLSGERIAGELGCTRAAVWKAVKSLREDGYRIEAGPNKGYMLAKDTNRLSQEGIRLFLDDSKVKIDIYDKLESTNQTAKKEAMMGETGHGAFVIARSQTAGRGRRGRGSQPLKKSRSGLKALNRNRLLLSAKSKNYRKNMESFNRIFPHCSMFR